MPTYGEDKLTRWLLPQTQPKFLSTEHPVVKDIACAIDEIERLRAENEWLKSQLPRTPEAAAAGGGFDPSNP